MDGDLLIQHCNYFNYTSIKIEINIGTTHDVGWPLPVTTGGLPGSRVGAEVGEGALIGAALGGNTLTSSSGFAHSVICAGPAEQTILKHSLPLSAEFFFF